MPKETMVCPSCSETVFAGKYCLKCGAELVNEQTAVIGEDVIEKIADSVFKRIKADMEENTNVPKTPATEHPASEQPASGQPAEQPRSLFRKPAKP